MKNYKICIKAALAVFALALSACSSDDDIADTNSNSQEKPVTNKTMTFRATMDDGSGSNIKAPRTTFTDNNGTTNTVWATGDKIYILNTADVDEKYPAGGEFTIDSPANGSTYTKEENFTGDTIKANGSDNDQFYAYYPSSSFDTNNEVMTGTIPTVQTPTDGTYPQTLHYMTAYSTNSTFKFKNVCALLKITLTNNTTISRIKVVANPTLDAMDDQEFKYTSIAGGFTATIDDNGIATTTATETKKTYVELHAAGDNTAKTSLGNGTFYMVVLPAQLKNGFTLLLEDKNENVYQRINTKTTSFARNQMYNLGTYDCSSTPTNMTALGNDVVDLDLPSGTIWCKKNVVKTGLLGNSRVNGFASSETGYGDYFSWGKTYFTGASLYGNNIPDHPDNTLANQYDAVYTYNHTYCMPIRAQMYEFYNHFPDANKESHITYRSWGINPPATDGYAKFTAPTGTGRTIYLPYGGHYYSTITSLTSLGSPSNQYERAAYWSRTFYGRATINNFAYCLDMKEDSKGLPISDDHSGLDLAIEWADNVVAGRLLRPVITNEQIAPIK